MTRRHFTIAAPLSLAILLAMSLNLACTGKHSTTVQNDEGTPGPPPIVSALKMGDPSAKTQLTKGFYDLEAGSWRWTAGSFSVNLKTPPGAAQKGATLTLAITIPDTSLQQLHSQTLSAAVGASALKSEKYSDAGVHIFTATVPASALSGDTVTIDFSLDNTLPPAVDKRTLGVIVNSVGLESN